MPITKEDKILIKHLFA